MPTYRVTDKTTGIEWGKGEEKRRVESGETANDIPAESVKSLLSQGLIEEVVPGITTADGDALDTQPLE